MRDGADDDENAGPAFHAEGDGRSDAQAVLDDGALDGEQELEAARVTGRHLFTTGKELVDGKGYVEFFAINGMPVSEAEWRERLRGWR